MVSSYPIVPISTAGISGFGVVILALVILGCVMLIPSTAPGTYVLRPVAVLVLALAATFGFFLYRTYASNVTLHDDSISLNVPLYSRTVPYELIVVGEVSLIDHRDNDELSLAIRTNGVGMPGYLLGQFKTRTGRRAFVALTDPSKVVYVPLTDGSMILLSIEKSEDFVHRLVVLGDEGNLGEQE